MRRALIAVLIVTFVALDVRPSSGQQVPFLPELLSRFEQFNRIYADKRRAGQNVSALELSRKKCEQALKSGDVPAVLEAIGEAQALVAGKKWDERQKFIASLTVETDRLVIEPNQVLQVSLTRMYPSSTEKAFPNPPTVTFAIMPGEVGSSSSEAASVLALGRGRPGSLPTAGQEPVVIAQRMAIGETSSSATRKLLLPEGAYQVVALIESEGKAIAEVKRQVYAISDFSNGIAQHSRTIAGIRKSNDPNVKAVAQLVDTPAFQIQRLSKLNKTRGEIEINPIQELDRVEGVLGALAKGQNPFAAERGEVERAYQASDGSIFPYRLYVPKSYNGSTPIPLVVMMHGALGDERYFFSGLFDPAIVKSEADRHGFILAGLNGRGRFAVSQDDVFEVIKAVTRDYKIDASRVCLLGHSLGGVGAWIVAAAKPELFAAIAAVSGGPPAQGDALTALLAKLNGKPAMVVHGAQDGIAPVQLSRTMTAAAEKAGLKVSYVEVPDADHLSVVASTFPAVMAFFEKSTKTTGTK
jgi:predicted peptidase